MHQDKILIVDDELIIARDLQSRLADFGYTITGIAADYNEAVESITNDKPELVLMDIMLRSGQMDGIDAAQKIKEEYNIPSIFITAYSDEKTIARARRINPLGYILKPFKEREVVTTIDIGLYKYRFDQDLARQERWLKAVLESIGDGLIVTDSNDVIKLLNPIAETLTGWQEEEAAGTNVNEILYLVDEKTMDPITVKHVTASLKHGSSFFIQEALIKNRYGALVHTEGCISPIMGGEGSIEGMVYAFKDITEIKKLSESITYHSSHDYLTGLVNREQFSHRLKHLIEKKNGSVRNNTLLYLDIDKFKVINETCGHSAGDDLLRMITDILQDMAKTDDLVCARVGADEFALLLQEKNIDESERLAYKLQKRISTTPFSWQHETYFINCTIGLVALDQHTPNVKSAFSAASDICFTAKEEGGNRIKIFREEDTAVIRRRGELQWIARLTKAIKKERFVLYSQRIQPRVPGSDRVHHEILLRIEDEEGNNSLPKEFIPPAERYNLMPTIDRWMIKRSFEEYRRIMDSCDDFKDAVFNINITSSTIEDETLLDYILTCMENNRVPPEAICLELTENIAIENDRKAREFIENVRKCGIKFSLDDFGSGFNSFEYLKELPVDFVKIDGQFFREFITNPINQTIVSAINSICHELGIKTIAEYIENNEIKDAISDLNIDYYQGFAIQQPVPLSQIK